MTNGYEPQGVEIAHHVALEARSKLAVSGVKDVESFDEAMIVLETVRGVLVVRGEGLHLQMLSLEGGQVSVTGRVDSLTYEDGGEEKQGFFARLLG